MPPSLTDEGVQASSWSREDHPTIGAVVLSQNTAPAYALALSEDGLASRAYLLKERVAGANELAHTIAKSLSVSGRGGEALERHLLQTWTLRRARPQSSRQGRLRVFKFAIGRLTLPSYRWQLPVQSFAAMR